MNDEKQALDTQTRAAIQAEVKTAIREALHDVPDNATVNKMIAQQVTGINAIVDAKMENYMRMVIDPILTDMQRALTVFQKNGDEINAIKVMIAGMQVSINQILNGFTDMKATQARLDDEHEQDRQRMDIQNVELVKTKAQHAELRRDIFGGNGGGPQSMLEMITQRFDRQDTLVQNNIAALTQRYEALEIRMSANEQWILSRQKMEKLAAKYIGGMFKGAGGLLKSRAFWALLVSGGGIGSIITFLLWLMENAQ